MDGGFPPSSGAACPFCKGREPAISTRQAWDRSLHPLTKAVGLESPVCGTNRGGCHFQTRLNTPTLPIHREDIICQGKKKNLFKKKKKKAPEQRVSPDFSQMKLGLFIWDEWHPCTIPPPAPSLQLPPPPLLWDDWKEQAGEIR